MLKLMNSHEVVILNALSYCERQCTYIKFYLKFGVNEALTSSGNLQVNLINSLSLTIKGVYRAICILLQAVLNIFLRVFLSWDCNLHQDLLSHVLVQFFVDNLDRYYQ